MPLPWLYSSDSSIVICGPKCVKCSRTPQRTPEAHCNWWTTPGKCSEQLNFCCFLDRLHFGCLQCTIHPPDNLCQSFDCLPNRATTDLSPTLPQSHTSETHKTVIVPFVDTSAQQSGQFIFPLSVSTPAHRNPKLDLPYMAMHIYEPLIQHPDDWYRTMLIITTPTRQCKRSVAGWRRIAHIFWAKPSHASSPIHKSNWI